MWLAKKCARSLARSLGRHFESNGSTRAMVRRHILFHFAISKETLIVKDRRCLRKGSDTRASNCEKTPRNFSARKQKTRTKQASKQATKHPTTNQQHNNQTRLYYCITIEIDPPCFDPKKEHARTSISFSMMLDQ